MVSYDVVIDEETRRNGQVEPEVSTPACEQGFTQQRLQPSVAIDWDVNQQCKEVVIVILIPVDHLHKHSLHGHNSLHVSEVVDLGYQHYPDGAIHQRLKDAQKERFSGAQVMEGAEGLKEGGLKGEGSEEECRVFHKAVFEKWCEYL